MRAYEATANHTVRTANETTQTRRGEMSVKLSPPTVQQGTPEVLLWTEAAAPGSRAPTARPLSSGCGSATNELSNQAPTEQLLPECS